MLEANQERRTDSPGPWRTCDAVWTRQADALEKRLLRVGSRGRRLAMPVLTNGARADQRGPFLSSTVASIAGLVVGEAEWMSEFGHPSSTRKPPGSQKSAPVSNLGGPIASKWMFDFVHAF